MAIVNYTITYPSVPVATLHVDYFCRVFDYSINKNNNETQVQFAKRMFNQKIIREIREQREHVRLMDAYAVVQQQAPLPDDNITVT